MHTRIGHRWASCASLGVAPTTTAARGFSTSAKYTEHVSTNSDVTTAASAVCTTPSRRSACATSLLSSWRFGRICYTAASSLTSSALRGVARRYAIHRSHLSLAASGATHNEVLKSEDQTLSALNTTGTENNRNKGNKAQSSNAGERDSDSNNRAGSSANNTDGDAHLNDHAEGVRSGHSERQTYYTSGDGAEVDTGSAEAEGANGGEGEEGDGASSEGLPASAPASAAVQLPHLQQDEAALALVQSTNPISTLDEIHEMLKGAKNAQEVRQVLERVVYVHHLCFDVLNGHGFRVAVLQSLTNVAPRLGCMAEWFDCVDRFRRLGFLLTRTYAADGFTTIRQWLTNEFQLRGRVPAILTDGTGHIRELVQWCLEDRLVFDHVLYTRIVFLLTMVVSFFDRQNLYRVSFPSDFAKRDGIVVEWIITNERCLDYDECVLQCDALMEELLEQMRHQIPSRPPFSFMYRLADYYFATDNVDKLIAVMEDAESYGMCVAESTTAKLMQLACAFNYPQVPELLLRWRVLLPQCVLATPDMSRLLFYFSRSGGGLPCPHCGDAYNHRNVSVYHWLQTPPHQRQCPALHLARVQKGELEESRELPQNADWSTQAFQLFALSRERAIEWTATEWRGFLLCCMFAPTARAREARELLDAHLPPRSMDDFLRATYMRLLRHHEPASAWPTLRSWRAQQCNMSPIALQEALMATAMIDDVATRVDHTRQVWRLLLEKDSYVMPLTRRFYEARRAALARQRAASSEDGNAVSRGGAAVDPAVIAEDARLMDAVITMQPRHVSLLDMKDSAADFVVGTRRKNVYHPPNA